MPETPDLQPTPPCAAHLITKLGDLEDLARRILAGPDVAVDTESDSLYSYTEKICLVQFSLPDGDYIVDPLAIYSLEPLADVFASATVQKVFHGADYDVVSLKRGYGFHFANIFDTMLASRILGRKNCGLAALLADYLGLRMDKSMQRSDWGKRPLSAEQLAYACHDTRYLLTLRDLLRAELRQLGREDEANEAFAELTSLEPRPRFFDPDGFWNIKGVRDLDSGGQRVVHRLYRWRDDQARWEDRPVFKVLNDRALLVLAREQPTSFDALRRRRIMSDYQLARYGGQVIDIIAKAQRAKDHLRPPRPRRSTTGPDEQSLAIYQKLRAWRKERAAARGVEPDVVASNDQLMALATQCPRTVADLEGIVGLGRWWRSEYGADVVAVINHALAGGDTPRRLRRSPHTSDA